MRKLIAAILLVATLSCKENTILEANGTANFSITGLPALPSSYTYQTWLLVSGTYVSMGTFNVDDSGASSVTGFENINNNDLANATGVAVTIEFTGTGSKSSPSDLIILAGDFSDNTATLVTDDTRTIYAPDLKADYIIDAPTALKTEKSNTGQNGIWFSNNIDQSADTAGLLLPYNQNDGNKTPSDLIYQTWLYAPNTANTTTQIALNMGTFTEANSQDNLNNYAGTLVGFTPVLPGNDFVTITNQNVDSPLEVLGKRVIITAKPNEGTITDASPFAFVLFDKTIDLTDGTLNVFQNNYSAIFTKN